MLKQKQAQISMGKVIVAFMAVIVAITLIVAVANNQSKLTTKQVTTNETVVIPKNDTKWDVNETTARVLANAPSTTNEWRQAECPIESVTGKTSNNSNLVLNTDYTLNATNGTIMFLNTSKTVNTTAFSNNTVWIYTWCDEGYNKDSASRTIVGLITIFLAIALAVTAYFGYKKIVG